jgi:hypothetical protein
MVPLLLPESLLLVLDLEGCIETAHLDTRLKISPEISACNRRYPGFLLPLFMVLDTGIPVLRKFMLKNLQKITFGEGQVQDPIPALLGHGSKIPAVLLIDRDR